MNTRYLRLVQACAVCMDFLSLNTIVLFSELWLERINDSFSVEYARFWTVLNISWLVVSWIGNLYSEKNIATFESFSRRSMHVFSYWVVAILFYLFFSHQYGLSRLFIAVVLMSQGIMLLVNRFMYLAVHSYFKYNRFMVRNVIILGYNDTAKKLANYLEEEGRYINIVGFCEEESNVQELTHYPIISSLENVMDVSLKHGVSEIYSTIAPEHDLGIYQIMHEADRACIRFRLIPNLSYFINRSFHIDYLKDIPVLSLRREPLEDAGNKIKKRLFDLFVSALAIVFVLSWMIPILGLLIYLESPGPIFFRQKRTGQNKKTFECFKFRSMKVNKDANQKQASKDDNRFTRIGRILRKTSLDEFPQFINVLRGEMSIVGPRPHMLKHTDDYSKVIDQYMVRQFVKPGITGWAQINGYRGETRTLEQMMGRVEHDIWYLENWSLWLDVKIVFLTAYNVIRGEENAF